MKLKYVKSKGVGNLSAKEARIVGNELKRIQQRESVITPKRVVESASNPKSPLHRFFEWDDSIAAQRHREWQARFLLCSVFIADADDENSQPIRAFVNCSPVDDEDNFTADRGYVGITSIAGKQSYQMQVLTYAKNQLIGWKNRFGNYKEFFGVVREIDSLK